MKNKTYSLIKRNIYRLLGLEISLVSRYCDRLVQVEPSSADSGGVLDHCDCPRKMTLPRLSDLVPLSDKDDRSLYLLNGNFNYQFDIQGKLLELYSRLSRHSRVAVVLYNPYLRWLYILAGKLGFRQGEQPSTFVTRADLENLVNISGFEVVRIRPSVFFPWRWFGFGDSINYVLPWFPFLSWLGLAWVVLLRPIVKETCKPSLSIVIPARNEMGNIENALRRLPDFGGAPLEIIFVEGHSHDGTWNEILRVQKAYGDRFRIKAFQQRGKGKADAVRLGFANAEMELLTILDADLTMPPELLNRFYIAYMDGYADFANGSRLVYAMEGDAMRRLNWLGNVFFAKALSFVLGVSLGDSLCGTKLVTRRDYARMTAWRNDFGDFDPFGDYELLFPASILALGIVDIPIRYRARTYGSTNISRFSHGLMLLRMTLIGLFMIRSGRAVGFPGLAVHDLDQPDRERLLRDLIQNKAGLHRFYEEIYGRYSACLNRCPANGLAVELGSGAGFAKQIIPDLVATDVIAYHGVDQVVDAMQMPFENSSLRGLFLLNTLHHIPDAYRFFSEATRCLMPGGRMYIVDQNRGWLSTPILKYFHHEGWNASAASWEFESTGPLSSANAALAWIIFVRDRSKFETLYPNLRIEKIERHTPLRYWLCGGLKSWTVMPGWSFGFFSRLDKIMVRLFPSLGSFIDIEIIRIADVGKENQ